jgi:hypothetical protein
MSLGNFLEIVGKFFSFTITQVFNLYKKHVNASFCESFRLTYEPTYELYLSTHCLNKHVPYIPTLILLIHIPYYYLATTIVKNLGFI